MGGNESKIQDVLKREATRRGFLKGMGVAAGVTVPRTGACCDRRVVSRRYCAPGLHRPASR